MAIDFPLGDIWVYLSAGLGRNLPMMLVDRILGRGATEMAPARPGVLFIRYAVEAIVSQRDFESVVMNGGQRLHRAADDGRQPRGTPLDVTTRDNG